MFIGRPQSILVSAGPQGFFSQMPLPTLQSLCSQEKTKADFEGTPAPADGAEPAAETAQADGEAAGDGEEAIDSAADEVDKRSVYVGNVDYEVTPEELQEHFKASCGSVVFPGSMGMLVDSAALQCRWQDLVQPCYLLWQVAAADYC